MTPMATAMATTLSGLFGATRSNAYSDARSDGGTLNEERGWTVLLSGERSAAGGSFRDPFRHRFLAVLGSVAPI